MVCAVHPCVELSCSCFDLTPHIAPPTTPYANSLSLVTLLLATVLFAPYLVLDLESAIICSGEHMRQIE